MLEDGPFAVGIVYVHRVSAACDAVVELARAQHVLGGQLVIAQYATRFAHADVHAALGDVGALESRHVLAQESGDLTHLLPPAPFRITQVPDIDTEYACDT